VVFDEKSFCCDGCRSVYELLDAHQLCQYYRYDDRPGHAPPALARFEYLDNPEIAAQLLDFHSETLHKVTLYVPAMHCSACLYLLENLPRLHPGVRASRVDFLKKQVAVDYNPTALSLRQLAELLAQIGYEPLIRLNDAETRQRPVGERQLLTRLGVAGFCAGNIMLFAFPEYLGLEELRYRHLFGYLNFALALPALFYAGWGYFESVFNSLRQRRINIDLPILLAMLTTFGRGTYEVFTGTGGGYFDSLTGLIFLLLTGKWFQQKTYDAIRFDRDYTSYFPLAVTRMVGNGQLAVGSENSGDNEIANCKLPIANFTEESIPVQRLRPGDRIVIRNGELLPADARLLAGKARMDYSFVTGESAPETHAPGEVLLAGGRQVGERLELEVLRDVSHSYLTQLWNHDAFRKGDTSRLRTFADRVGQSFTYVVFTLAVLVAGYWYVGHGDAARALNAFTAVLIVACPCALSLSYPFALGNGLRIFGKRGFYLKNAEVMETLARCDALVFDKTGTLTTADGAGACFVPVPSFDPLTASGEALAGALARQSTHPISQKIARMFAPNETDLALTDVQEIPGEGVAGWFGECEIRLGSAQFAQASDGLNIAADGAIAHLNLGGQYRGYFVVKAEYRPGLDGLLASLRDRFALFLVSGDGEAERPRLLRWFQPERMRFRTQPTGKLRFVESLQAEGHRVVMLGDGLNDAGALRQADAGIAVTENTLQFTPASDAILEARALPELPRFLRYCRHALRVIQVSFAVSLVYNGIGLSFAVTGHLSPVVAAILMPVSSFSMVLITTVGMRHWGRKWFGEDV
jgi:Cu+-exporting ATPase